jgi:hypothetical protein
MASDNILHSTNKVKTCVTSLRKKLSSLRGEFESFESELSKIETRVENVISQSEIYKTRIEREMGREVRRLERELELLRQESSGKAKPDAVSESDLRVAATVAILDSILRLMCQGNDDFRLASEAFLFPAVYERVVDGSEEAYYLEHVPTATSVVIRRGLEHISWIRSEFDTHLTDPETWEKAIAYIVDWWRNDALPMLYGARDEQWDIDVPMSLPEILLWRESPGDRPLNFPKIFDAYEIYRRHKDEIYGTTGLREFELKHFSF